MEANTKPKKRYYKKGLVLVLLYGGLVVFLFTTNPSKVPVGWLLIPFMWLYAALFISFRWLFAAGKSSAARRRRATGLAAMAASLPVLMLLLDSINQLTVRDVILFVAFGTVGLFYVSKLGRAE